MRPPAHPPLLHPQVPGVPVTIGTFRLALPETFVAHGWEPVTATQAFDYFANPAFARAFGHLRGQTVRFGGISADFLAYFVDASVAPACRWSDLTPFFAPLPVPAPPCDRLGGLGEVMATSPLVEEAAADPASTSVDRPPPDPRWRV